MKRLLACAAALGLLASAPSWAQENDHHGEKHDAATSQAGRTAPSDSDRGGRDTTSQNGHAITGGAHTKAVAGPPNTAAGSGPGHTSGTDSHQNSPASNTTANRFLPPSGDTRRNDAGRATADRAQSNSGWSGNTAGRPPAVNSRQGGSNWSGHSDVKALRRNMQATQRFHGSSYNAPRGYQYRHWSYGERLPSGYFVRNYWIANFVIYGLFAPPPDLVWVRVGDDALLIDQENGDIVQVRYGVFY